MNYGEAQQYCLNTYGTNLATIIDQDDLNAFYAARHLAAVPQDQSLIIGLNDISNEGTFSWQDGTACTVSDGTCIGTCDTTNVMKFNCGEPNNSHGGDGEDAVEFTYNANREMSVNDIKTTETRPFVCGKDDDCKNIDSILNSCSTNYATIRTNLESKISSSQVNADLALKADKTTTDTLKTQIDEKASSQSVTDLNNQVNSQITAVNTRIDNLVNDLNNVNTDNATPTLFGIDKDALILDYY
eukprot:CAMPEP_0201572766 /NCGR_PEP_ID=MMETSP0190_2-20130828/16215_1 /ASSEMBLY_ACC=CAM_ASM_000263 /TAXON_ID=37353 /ORGANISM="Rosalina sp." /LENGTH=242 /DNA_ID=CAMNT_0047998923 /DNA_START=195 /DNA_END=924 /DNA_ORIENTATION=+